MNWRTAHKRKARLRRYEPIKCSKHAAPFRGGGWVYAAGLRFALLECPRPHCRQFRLLQDRSVQPATLDLDLF